MLPPQRIRTPGIEQSSVLLFRRRMPGVAAAPHGGGILRRPLSIFAKNHYLARADAQ